MTQDLTYLSATEALRLFRSRQLSPVELMQAVIERAELGHYLEGVLTPAFNVTNRCPVLAVPSGRASNGLPTSVQIVGPTYDDERVFRAGAALERVRPWFGDPSWRPPL